MVTGPRAGLVAVLFLTIGCGPASPPAGRRPDLDRLLPPASMLAGWRAVEGPAEYLPPNLYEYLDGGAERYLAHGFRRLVHVRYETGEGRAGVTLDLYDMGEATGAFGIFRSGLGENDPPGAWCTESFRTGSIGAAWKGPVFVHASADDEADEGVLLVERLLDHACAGMPGTVSLPALLAPIPKEGLVSRSERFEPAGLLGHDFLPGGILATYQSAGRRARIFASRLKSASAARAALAKLRQHHADRGEVQEGIPAIGAGGFRFLTSKGACGTAVAAGRHVAGIEGEMPREAQERLLQQLVMNLVPER